MATVEHREVDFNPASLVVECRVESRAHGQRLDPGEDRDPRVSAFGRRRVGQVPVSKGRVDESSPQVVGAGTHLLEGQDVRLLGGEPAQPSTTDSRTNAVDIGRDQAHPGQPRWLSRVRLI